MPPSDQHACPALAHALDDLQASRRVLLRRIARLGVRKPRTRAAWESQLSDLDQQIESLTPKERLAP